jgi:hypothetical protein
MNKLETLRDQVLNMTLENCINDTSYNDNTLHDLILFGFKGLSNMTEAELQSELETLKQWEGA